MKNRGGFRSRPLADGAEFALLRRRLAAEHGFAVPQLHAIRTVGSSMAADARAARGVRQPHRRRSRALRRPQPGRHRAAPLFRDTRTICRRAASCSSARPPSRADRRARAARHAGVALDDRPHGERDELVQPTRPRANGAASASSAASPARARWARPLLRALRRRLRRHRRRQRDQTTGPHRPPDAAREPHGHAGLSPRWRGRWARSSQTRALRELAA